MSSTRTCYYYPHAIAAHESEFQYANQKFRTSHLNTHILQYFPEYSPDFDERPTKRKPLVRTTMTTIASMPFKPMHHYRQAHPRNCASLIALVHIVEYLHELLKSNYIYRLRGLRVLYIYSSDVCVTELSRNGRYRIF